MNILQTEDTIKGFPDARLMQEAQQPSGEYPQYLLVSEVQRRTDMRKRYEQQQAEQPEGTVADQIMQGAGPQQQGPPTQGPPPQGPPGQVAPNMSNPLPTGPGIAPNPNQPPPPQNPNAAMLPPGNGGMAGGGILRLATGGGTGQYDNMILKYADAYGIDPEQLRSQIEAESSFDPNAVSGAGATGLMQIMPATAANPGYGMTGIDPATLTDPETNINFGAEYYSKMRDRFGGDDTKALQAYHSGAGNVDRGTLGPEGQAYPGKVLGSSPQTPRPQQGPPPPPPTLPPPVTGPVNDPGAVAGGGQTGSYGGAGLDSILMAPWRASAAHGIEKTGAIGEAMVKNPLGIFNPASGPVAEAFAAHPANFTTGDVAGVAGDVVGEVGEISRGIASEFGVPSEPGRYIRNPVESEGGIPAAYDAAVSAEQRGKDPGVQGRDTSAQRQGTGKPQGPQQPNLGMGPTTPEGYDAAAAQTAAAGTGTEAGLEQDALTRLMGMVGTESPKVPDVSDLIAEQRNAAYSQGLIQLGAGIAGNDMSGGISRAGVAMGRGNDKARQLDMSSRMAQYGADRKDIDRDINILGTGAKIEATADALSKELLRQGRLDRRSIVQTARQLTSEAFKNDMTIYTKEMAANGITKLSKMEDTFRQLLGSTAAMMEVDIDPNAFSMYGESNGQSDRGYAGFSAVRRK